MKYKNTKTGWVIDIDSPLSGDNWVLFTGEEEQPNEDPAAEPAPAAEPPKAARRKKKDDAVHDS